MIEFFLGFIVGAAIVGLFVWAAARRERLAAEESDRRIEAADAAHREHMRALREYEDEMVWASVDYDDTARGER